MALFISFEGPDGSGKSTQVTRLAASLQDQGFDVVETREPGGTLLGERIREVTLDPRSPMATPLALAFLMNAARAQLVEEIIRPALDAGKVVIADRYADSTVAYQAFGLGVGRDEVDTLGQIATGGVQPDIVIYVDVSAEVGTSRVQARGKANRLDRDDSGFQERVRAGYRFLISQSPDRWIVIDGSAPPDQVHAEIMTALIPRLTEVLDPV